jgi:Gene product 88
MPTSLKVPGTTTNLLSQPDKLDGPWSFSLPAGETCPGKVTGEGTICGTCYADPDTRLAVDSANGKRKAGAVRGGRYGFPATVRAQERRLAWTLECLMTAAGRDAWVALMTKAIRQKTRRHPYFRVHDSGDVFNPKYAQVWRRVHANLPEVQFWTPTRSWHQTPRILAALVDLATLPNAAVHPSALRIGDAPPVVDGLDAGSSVAADGYTCPASRQGNRCRTCRACYSKAGGKIFKLH